MGYGHPPGTRVRPSEDVKRVPKRMKEEAWLVEGKTTNIFHEWYLAEQHFRLGSLFTLSISGAEFMNV